MDRIELKKQRRRRRKLRVRKTAYGTPERPRLTVFRSIKHIYAQLIDDTAGRTLVSVSTLNKEVTGSAPSGGNVTAANVVGKVLAQRALDHGIKTAVFDRNGYRFHGRLKALAQGAREAGLKC